MADDRAATLDIRRNGDSWLLDDGVAHLQIDKPAAGMIETFILDWNAEEAAPMIIDTIAAYEAAIARIHELSDAKEGTAEAAELAALIAGVRGWEEHEAQRGDASSPGRFHTPRRPGQPGEESEIRPGPNPRSINSTGPHPPYESDDPEGIAAQKHLPARSEQAGSREPADRPSGTIRVVGSKGWPKRA